MNELKCPFCQQELDYLSEDIYGSRVCPNCHCLGWVLHGNDSMWQELIRTRKALDVAVNALNKIANTDIKVIEKEPWYYARAMFSVTNNALGRIQDIKQKDVK